ncbi:four-carbon acid sugar kinase family protein [Halorarum halophilum]|uniref:Four-carbon acid sugar kinase family protein n=1 Tax=Halorarum halophilum TaxID=2743090 RepID=A0A7D5GBG7_9EURY|nr:four-carbon acid sugar kinase family protein [Halobaculum halophilum]QLG27325.1 four-carbon acid sugar kinase family protein [Halobaculum halophilum]
MVGSDFLLAYYGDDFTGSTDVLEALSLCGVPTVLFLEPPEPGDLEEFDAVRAVGVAGTSRSMTPAEMEEELTDAFAALGRFDADVFQYKVCSTFDSSPEVGSIGRALDVGQRAVDSPFVPVVVAAPSLAPRGRYVLFGNLFATVDGETYRLDRHPTMRDHPVTPMREADLVDHLGEQTDRSVGNLEIRHLDGGADDDLDRALESTLAESDVVVFDGLNHDHQRTVGRLLWERRPDDGPLFAVGSSGLNYALADHWRSVGVVDDPDLPQTLDAVDRTVVVSGSASPVNAAQIEWALDHGFVGLPLDAPALVDPDAADDARARAVEAATDAIERGESPIVYSARGPDDSIVERTSARARELGIDDERVGRRLGRQQGRILRDVLAETGLERACVAGGDTSGYVVPELGIYALEFAAPVGPGSPLCRARSHVDTFDGLEIALKGGQVETAAEEPNFFDAVRNGGLIEET